MEVAEFFPEVKIRAYMDDVTMSSKNRLSLEAAFLQLRELSSDIGLNINFSKSEWFDHEATKQNNEQSLALSSLGVSKCDKNYQNSWRLHWATCRDKCSSRPKT